MNNRLNQGSSTPKAGTQDASQQSHTTDDRAQPPLDSETTDTAPTDEEVQNNPVIINR